MRARAIACLAALSCVASPVHALTTVTATTITASTTWGATGSNADDSVYISPSSGSTLTISNGATLTIQQGTVVLFATGKSMVVGSSTAGSLSAIGTLAQPIEFSSNNGLSGGWAGLDFADNSDLGGATSTLSNCLIRRGGSAGYQIRMTNTNGVTLSNCTIGDYSGEGLILNNATPAAMGCSFHSDTGTYPISGYAANVVPVVSTSILSPRADGKFNAVQIYGGTISASLALPKLPNGHCYITDSNGIEVRGAGSPVLTIADGTVVKFSSNGYLRTGLSGQPGGLKAHGVVFTSASDDTLGDTNGNGASVGASNQWDALYFDPTTLDAQTVVDSCVVRFAGQGGADAGIQVSDAEPTITRCVIEHNNTHGLRVENGGYVLGLGIHDNLLRNDDGFEMWAPPWTMANLVAHNTCLPSASGKTNGYMLRSGTISSSMNLPKPSAGFCYILEDNGQIIVRGSADPVLTIAAGTVVKLYGSSAQIAVGGSSSSISDRGSLVADSVAFVSSRYDTLGDTRGDGASMPAASDWAGLTFGTYADSTALLRNSAIQSAATGLWVTGNLPKVYRVLLDGNVTGALCSGSSNHTLFDQCDIVSNTTAGLLVQSGAAPMMSYCNVAENASYGVQNQSAATLTLANVWWGDPTGPAPSGSGDRVTGNFSIVNPLPAARPRLPGNTHPMQVVSLSWVASPVIADCDCTAPANAGVCTQNGKRWFENGFTETGWSPVTLLDSWGTSNADRYYRGHFQWVNNGNRLSLTFFSDDGLDLYCNGQLIGHFGPACHISGCVNYRPPCSPWSAANPVDLTPYLVEGDNVIAAHVTNAGSTGRFDASTGLTSASGTTPALIAMDLGTGMDVGLKWTLASPTTQGFRIYRESITTGLCQFLPISLSNDARQYDDISAREGESYRYYVMCGTGTGGATSNASPIVPHRPVVLLHGWRGAPSDMQVLATGLHDLGYTHVWVVDNLDACGLRNDNYKKLDSYLNGTKGKFADLYRANAAAGFAVRPVLFDVVAHSMGGLISRLYASKKPGSINRLIMIGTPNGGVQLPDKVRAESLFDPREEILRLLALHWLAGGSQSQSRVICAATDELGIASVRRLNLEVNDSGTACGVRTATGALLYNIAGNATDAIWPLTSVMFNPNDGNAPSDGVVLESSAFAVGGCNSVVDLTGNDFHSTLPQVPAVAAIVYSILQVQSPSPGPLAARRPSLAQSGPAAWQQIDLEGQRVAPNASVTFDFTSDPADSMTIRIASAQGTFDNVSITGPGTVVSSTTYSRDSLAAMTAATSHPGAGSWHITLRAISAFNDSMDVFASIRSLNGSSAGDSAWVIPSAGGSTVTVRTSVAQSGAPATGAVVKAYLEYVSGLRDSVALLDDGAHGDGAPGDGVYGGQRPAMDTKDAIDVLFRAAPAGSFTTGVQLSDLKGVEVGDLTPPSLSVQAPVQSDVWNAGETREVRWAASDQSGLASLEARLSTDGGVTFPRLMGTAPASQTSLSWSVPALLSDSCRVLVTAYDVTGNAATDTTVGLFSIHYPAGVGAPVRVELALGQAYPNPSRGGVRIPFGLPYPQRARLAVFDVQGRLIRVVLDEVRGPGRYVVAWDGRGAGGRAATPGLYFYRLQVTGRALTRKFALIQ